MALRGALSQSYRKYRKGCEMTQEKEYFILVPRTVARRNDLLDGAKLLYGEILALSKKTGFCYANNKHFIKAVGSSKSTIKRYLEALEDLNLISRKVIRNDKGAVTERRIYLIPRSDTPGLIDEPTLGSNEHLPGFKDEPTLGSDLAHPRPIDEPYNITLNNTYKYTESNTYKDKTISTISQYINNTVDKKDPDPEKRRDELLAQVREYQSGAKEDDLNE